MKIVRLYGGLGNQMFQYALGLSLSEKGNIVKYDKTWMNENAKYLGENFIDNVFSVNIDTASDEEICRLKNYKKDIIHRLGRKIGVIAKTYCFEEEQMKGEFQEKILMDSHDTYLEGYWQAERYFSAYKNKIQKAFAFRKNANSKSKEYLTRIVNDASSVAIHVRLGDYKLAENAEFGNVCTPDYYENAFIYIESKIDHPHYYLFSNEPKEAMEIMKNRQCCVIDCNSEQEGWNDMLMMTTCSHNIIANSSFSWWGAYLNNKKDKIVIAPRRWTNNSIRNGLNVEGWIRI